MQVFTPPKSTARSSTRSIWLGVIALLLLHAVLALQAVSQKSVTADEILHVTAGHVYNRLGDYRLHPENGNLPQRVAGLGASLTGARLPPLEDNVHWRKSQASIVGYQFFYESGNDHWPMLMTARALILLFGLGTGVIIFLWSRALFGTAAGLLALSLYALCPNFLAHNALATSDSASVFFLLAACGLFWRHVQAVTFASGTLSALTLGLCCVAKYSFVLLAPVFALFLLLRWLLSPQEERWPLARRLACSCLAHIATAALAIWAFYGFRYTGFAAGLPPADHYVAPWNEILPHIGAHAHLVEFCRSWRLLPEAFLQGYAWVILSTNARGAFLAGEYSIFGWPQFFPLAFLWKTPLAVLGACFIGLLALVRRWRSAPVRLSGDLRAVAPLGVFALVCWAIWIPSHLNIGHRHILPFYPVLFILLGGLAAPGVLSSRLSWALPLLLVGGQSLATVRTHPHYLAFFNTLAGGPAHGYRLLVDSSLDWGQDLPGLARHLRERQGAAAEEPVFLAYFGSGEPDYYGIRAQRLPFLNGFRSPPRWYRPGPGLYAISATLLQQVYSNVARPWTPQIEAEYQGLRESAPLFDRYFTDPSSRPELEQQVPREQWQRAWTRYDELRFARLCYLLRAREPHATIGHSILLYHVSADEARLAFDSSYAEWLMAIERLDRSR